MLLLALGFTVTKSVLTSKQIRWLICFICLISFCQFSLYIYQSDIFDPGLVLYIYESPPGYGLIILKLIAWIIFSLRCFKTVRKMSTKLHFYGSLFSLGSAWFLCHPLTVHKNIHLILYITKYYVIKCKEFIYSSICKSIFMIL